VTPPSGFEVATLVCAKLPHARAARVADVATRRHAADLPVALANLWFVLMQFSSSRKWPIDRLVDQ